MFPAKHKLSLLIVISSIESEPIPPIKVEKTILKSSSNIIRKPSNSFEVLFPFKTVIKGGIKLTLGKLLEFVLPPKTMNSSVELV